jgi:hypothetical protein
MRTLRWGMSGDDVADLQRALADLGFYAGPVDGRFGAQTRSAVLAFQRDQRLPADGIAGPLTLVALGLTEPAPVGGGGAAPAGEGDAISLHIGVNRVNPASYAGWSGPLSGCEQDARTMTRIAQAEGFTTNQLFTRDATSQSVLSAIAAAAGRLSAGGMFLLTYAGHGAQVPNESDDPEEDQQDETWVLYDRMLLDDELLEAFSAFKAGVNIVMLSDSCHSGTVYRVYSGSRDAEHALVKRSFYVNLALSRDVDSPLGVLPHPAVELRPTERRVRVVPAPVRQQSARRGGARALYRPMPFSGVPVGNGSGEGSEAAPATVQTRDMPFDVNELVVQEQISEYRAIQNRVRARKDVVANGVAISGCQDNQLSQEVGGAGVFTTTLARVWADNQFTGSYDAFHRAIVSQMAPNQTPVLGRFGADPDSLVERTPFDVSARASVSA